MNRGKVFIDEVEVGKQILRVFANEEIWENVDGAENKDFRRGAYWGMAMAMNYIFAYAPKYYQEEKPNEEDAPAPNHLCGSCPAWLAYGDASQIRNYPLLVKTCVETYRCPIVGFTNKEWQKILPEKKKTKINEEVN